MFMKQSVLVLTKIITTLLVKLTEQKTVKTAFARLVESPNVNRKFVNLVAMEDGEHS